MTAADKVADMDVMMIHHSSLCDTDTTRAPSSPEQTGIIEGTMDLLLLAFPFRVSSTPGSPDGVLPRLLHLHLSHQPAESPYGPRPEISSVLLFHSCIIKTNVPTVVPLYVSKPSLSYFIFTLSSPWRFWSGPCIILPGRVLKGFSMSSWAPSTKPC